MEEILEKTKDYWNEENTKKYEDAMQLLTSKIKEFDASYYEETGHHFIRLFEKSLKSQDGSAPTLSAKGKKRKGCRLKS